MSQHSGHHRMPLCDHEHGLSRFVPDAIKDYLPQRTTSKGLKAQKSLHDKRLEQAIQSPGLENAKFHQHGWATRIAQHKVFENLTLLVITLNAIWIGVDMELNEADIWLDANPVFQVADNAFCIFFIFEVCVRFLAYRSKYAIFGDWSFIFDCSLVFLMIAETWLLVIWAALSQVDSEKGGLRQLSILRLLRLLRLTRMVRLMREFPEIATLMKGLFQALRSVATTFAFLVASLWVFGIVFVQQYKDNDGPLSKYFSRLGISMITLFVNGTLLDGLAVVGKLLRQDSFIFLFIFFFFVLLSSLTLLNMLIGVLSQVVADTAEKENEHMQIFEAAQKLKAVFDIADADGDQTISRDEFEDMIQDPNSVCVKALVHLGIQEDRLRELSRQLFEDEHVDHMVKVRSKRRPSAMTLQTYKKLEDRKQTAGSPKSGSVYHSGSQGATAAWADKELTFPEFIDELLSLKPGSSVSVRDMWALRRVSSAVSRNLEGQMKQISEEFLELLQGPEAAASQLQNSELLPPTHARRSDAHLIAQGNITWHNSPLLSQAQMSLPGAPPMTQPPLPLSLAQAPKQPPSQLDPSPPVRQDLPKLPTMQPPTGAGNLSSSSRDDPSLVMMLVADEGDVAAGVRPARFEVEAPTEQTRPETLTEHTVSHVGSTSELLFEQTRQRQDGARHEQGDVSAKALGKSKLNEVPIEMILDEMNRRFSQYASLVDINEPKKRDAPDGWGVQKQDAPAIQKQDGPSAVPEEWYVVPGSFPSHLLSAGDSLYV